MALNNDAIVRFLVRLPSIVAAVAVIITSFLLLYSADDKQALVLTVAFALSELLMVVSALAGLVYLLSGWRYQQWLWANVGLFFTAGFTGVLSFLLV